mmetsp:Transcript_48340/g.135492  ORF Transcript_48340/g.135492 Transcript_48340/m.135492 type:complete len:332 (-) Transcript_48340:165-1160(-)
MKWRFLHSLPITRTLVSLPNLILAFVLPNHRGAAIHARKKAARAKEKKSEQSDKEEDDETMRRSVHLTEVSPELLQTVVDDQLHTIAALGVHSHETMCTDMNRVQNTSADVAAVVHAIEYGELEWETKLHAALAGVHLQSATITEFDLMRGSLKMKGSLCHIASMLTDESKHTLFDDALLRLDTVEELGSRAKLVHAQYREVWPYQQRDFVHLSCWTVHSSGGVCVASRSLRDSSFLTQENSLRATLHLGGFYISPLDETTEDGEPMCNVCMIAHLSLAGVPSHPVNWLMNLAIPGMLTTIEKLLEEHEVLPEFAANFQLECAAVGRPDLC